MIHSKLLQILRTLSKEEFIQFRKMLQSPFFVKTEMPLKFYDSIRRYHPKFDTSKLAKAKVFQKIYPDRKYDDTRMRGMMRRMTELLEQYLVWADLKTKKKDYQKRLTKIYSERQLFDLYKKERRQLLATLESQPHRDLNYYQDAFELHQEYYYHPQRQKFDPKDNTLLNLMHSIDHRFMLSKLRVGIEMRNQERIFQRKYDLEFIEAVLEKAADEENVVLQLFSLLFKLFSEERVADFELLEILFFTHVENLPMTDRQLIYYYGLNFVSRKLNEGNALFSSKSFDWYKFGLKDELLIRNGKITEVSFGNIVVSGCREKEFDWVIHFMKEYDSKINTNNLDDVLQFNKGLWHFYKGELEEAFTVLNHFDFHHSFQLKVRLTSLRILFEQFIADKSYFEIVRTYATTFQKFQSRTDFFSNSTIIPYKNTTEIIKSLVIKVSNFEEKRKIKSWLRQKLDTNQKFAVKKWLIKTIEEL